MPGPPRWRVRGTPLRTSHRVRPPTAVLPETATGAPKPSPRGPGLGRRAPLLGATAGEVLEHVGPAGLIKGPPTPITAVPSETATEMPKPSLVVVPGPRARPPAASPRRPLGTRRPGQESVGGAGGPTMAVPPRRRPSSRRRHQRRYGSPPAPATWCQPPGLSWNT